MIQQIITNYTFNVIAKTITLNDPAYSTIVLERLQLITNVTTNIIIYNFANPGSAVIVSNNVITLTGSLPGMANTDRLQIIYSPPVTTDVQLVSVSILPLPTGGATSANQVTGNTSLGSIDSKIPAPGQALAVGSIPVVLPTSQITTLTPPAAIANYANETGGNLAAIKIDADSLVLQVGPISTTPTANTLQDRLKSVFTAISGVLNIRSLTSASDSVTTVPSGTQTISGIVTANASTNLNTSSLALESGGNLTAINTNTSKIPSQGTAIISSSMPVNIASNQVVPTSVSSLPLPTGAATSALQTTGNTSLASIVTSTSNIPVLGQAASANSTPVVLSNDRLMNLNKVTSDIYTYYPDLLTQYPDLQGAFIDTEINPNDPKQWTYHYNSGNTVLRGSPIVVDEGYLSPYSMGLYAYGNNSLVYARKSRGGRTIPSNTTTLIFGAFISVEQWWQHGLYQIYFGFDSQQNSPASGNVLSRDWSKICYLQNTGGTGGPDDNKWQVDLSFNESTPTFSDIPNSIQGSPSTTTVYPIPWNEPNKPMWIPVWFSFRYQTKLYSKLSLNGGDLTIDLSSLSTAPDTTGLPAYQNGFNIIVGVQNRNSGTGPNIGGVTFQMPFLAYSKLN